MPSPALPFRILSEQLAPVTEPLALLVRPGAEAAPAAVVSRAARALLDRGPLAQGAWPAWLAPHQVPAARRVVEILDRFGGAVLADAVGLGKSYVALAAAQRQPQPVLLVVPAILRMQWRRLLSTLSLHARIVTHESLSGASPPLLTGLRPAFVIVDEAHRFRNPATRRYRRLARIAVGTRLLCVTATPVHNHPADLLHLFRLFLRDHALTALGLPSLRLAARSTVATERITAIAARLVVARTRQRADSYASPWAGAFPARTPGRVLRCPPCPRHLLAELTDAVCRLPDLGAASPLLRLLLLRRLGSSLPALRETLQRQRAFLDIAAAAAREGRALTRPAFARAFPRGDEPDLQLSLFAMMLPPGGAHFNLGASAAIDALIARLDHHDDPKLRALDRLLADARKTIVFAGARATVRYLARALRARHRLGAITAAGAHLGAGPATRREVLDAFAPRAQGAHDPEAARTCDALLVTDLASEGLNLQDAERIVHFDLPWSPARLAQRVGRIDRMGSAHRRIETVTFLPPAPLARALRLEARLAAKARWQGATGGAQVETTTGARPTTALDWCDQLDPLTTVAPAPAAATCCVAGADAETVLVIRTGGLAEAFVVTRRTARVDPVRAAALLASTATAPPRPLDRRALDQAVAAALPLVRARLAAVRDARWRAADRDHLARRLTPMVLQEARRAARAGTAERVARCDALLERLTGGMTAGEELLLDDLLEDRRSLSLETLLRWHHQLPPVATADPLIACELIAAVVVTPDR